MKRCLVRKTATGFSLPEVLVAMGVAAIGLLSLIGLMASVSPHMNEGRMKREMYALSDVVQETLGRKLAGEAAEADDTIEVVYAYRYRAKSTLRADGSHEPETGDEERILVQNAVRLEDDPLLSSDLTALEGLLFRLEFEEEPVTGPVEPDSPKVGRVWFRHCPDGTTTGPVGKRVGFLPLYLWP